MFFLLFIKLIIDKYTGNKNQDYYTFLKIVLQILYNTYIILFNFFSTQSSILCEQRHFHL